MRQISLVAGALLVMWALAAGSASGRQAAPGTALQRVGGRSLGAWEAAWWQWRLTFPADGGAAEQGGCLQARQTGPVWFLDGEAGALEGVQRVRCAVPEGRDILVVSPSLDCSTAERGGFHAITDEGLVECASREWQYNRPLGAVWLDGARLRQAPYLTATAPFPFVMPALDNLLDAWGTTSGRAAVIGFVTLLAPLRRGHHVIVVRSRYRWHRPKLLTYSITVR